MRLRRFDCEECGQSWDPKRCWKCDAYLDASGFCELCNEAPRTDVCPRCLRDEGVESPGTPRSAATLFPPREDELAELSEWYTPLLLAYASFGTLGQDPNGRPLWSEQLQFLNEHGVLDMEERRLWQACWRVIAGEKARHLSEKLDT